MYAALTISRYPSRHIFFALWAMFLFRIACRLNKKFKFWKLLGCGKNGSFDIHPDWHQWGILIVFEEATIPSIAEPGPGNSGHHDKIKEQLYGQFITRWWNYFKCETWTVILEPIEGHGKWDGKEIFGKLPTQSDHEGPIAVLTRANIRFNRLAHFWKHVHAVNTELKTAEGLVISLGIGEWPLKRQATFSIWESERSMKAFAYQLKAHQEVIRKTREENWYREEMFVRFKLKYWAGSLKAITTSRFESIL